MRKSSLLFLLALGACANPPIVKPDSPLQEKAVFEDVPIPAGLTYDEGFGKRTPGGIRVYTQKFSGKQRPVDICSFYEKTLPVHGWSQTEKDRPKTADAVETLRFVKKDENCVITICPTTTGVLVTVRLDYKN